MGAQQVFETLLANGVNLYLLNDNTIRAAPFEAVTPTARAMIREHKAGLLDLLRQLEATGQATTPAVPGNTQDRMEADPDLDDSDFSERAGIPRQWAEGLARLCTMPRPSDIEPRRWLAIVNAAALFADRWAVMAAKLGWTVHECFGVHQDCPARRFDAAGLLMALADPSKTLVELTQDLAIFEVGRMRARQTLHRDMIFSHEQRLLWELK